jgi:hypothetical protein
MMNVQNAQITLIKSKDSMIIILQNTTITYL